MKEGCMHGAEFGAALAAPRILDETALPRARYDVECVSALGVPRWHDGFANLVVTSGRNDLLTQYFKGSGYNAAWFIGLIDNTGFSTIAAGDTMGAHPGWSESAAYANANRPTLVLGSASAGSVDNAASVAAFSINAAATLRGAFIATSGTKGGAAGTLYSAGAFASTRAVSPGDTLNITVTLSAS